MSTLLMSPGAAVAVAVAGLVGLLVEAAPAGGIALDKLTAGDADEGDQFGIAVSLGCGVAIVGAWFEDEAARDAGAAYVFRRDGAAWSEDAKLTSADADVGDGFGVAVSVDGDRALIGALGDGEAGDRAGAAYIFERRNGTWMQIVKLIAADAEPGDRFGAAVALSGDTALIGAPAEAERGAEAGAAYVFRLETGTWEQQAKLTAGDGDEFDRFGSALGLDGNIAVIGAKDNDGVAPLAGAAYVFRRTGDTWSPEQKLTALDGGAVDHFGVSIGVFGENAIIGAHFEDEAAPNAGAAYVFRRTGVEWMQEDKLIAGDAEAGDFFGSTVALGDDVAVVGAPVEDERGDCAGAVYVFRRVENAWSETDKVLAPDGGMFDQFGSALALRGERFLAGAAFDDDDDSTDEGAAYAGPLASCVADIDRDGDVGFGDLLVLLRDYGPCPPAPDACRPDLNGDCAVDFNDLLILLRDFGPCA